MYKTLVNDCTRNATYMYINCSLLWTIHFIVINVLHLLMIRNLSIHWNSHEFVLGTVQNVLKYVCSYCSVFYTRWAKILHINHTDATVQDKIKLISDGILIFAIPRCPKSFRPHIKKCSATAVISLFSTLSCALMTYFCMQLLYFSLSKHQR